MCSFKRHPGSTYAVHQCQQRDPPSLSARPTSPPAFSRRCTTSALPRAAKKCTAERRSSLTARGNRQAGKGKGKGRQQAWEGVQTNVDGENTVRSSTAQHASVLQLAVHRAACRHDPTARAVQGCKHRIAFNRQPPSPVRASTSAPTSSILPTVSSSPCGNNRQYQGGRMQYQGARHVGLPFDKSHLTDAEGTTEAAAEATGRRHFMPILGVAHNTKQARPPTAQPTFFTAPHQRCS